jgi:hypothetical protein
VDSFSLENIAPFPDPAQQGFVVFAHLLFFGL